MLITTIECMSYDIQIWMQLLQENFQQFTQTENHKKEGQIKNVNTS